MNLYLIETPSGSSVVCCGVEGESRLREWAVKNFECSDQDVKIGLLGIAHPKTPPITILTSSMRANGLCWDNIERVGD